MRSPSVVLILASILGLAGAGGVGCKGGKEQDHTEPPPRTEPPARFAGARQATEPTREAARAAHQEALRELEDLLGKNHTVQKFNLSDDFRAAKAAAEQVLARHKDEPGPRINIEYLWADPYLRRHAQDINTLMPEEVTGPEWQALKQALHAYPKLVRQDELDAALGVIEASDPVSRSITRKRLYRLYKVALEQDQADLRGDGDPEAPGALTPMEDLALHLSNQVNRCIDGLLSGLGEMEQRILGEGQFRPAHLGEVISVLATDEKAAFFRLHLGLEQKDPNFRAHTLFFLEQRMLMPLGLRGQFVPVKYFGFKWDKVPELQPAAMMERFLNGQKRARLPNGHGVVDFPRYDVDRLVDLLQKARSRGFVNASGKYKNKAGWRIDGALLMNECVIKGPHGDLEPRDPVVGPAYLNFFCDNYGAVANAYFEPAAPGDHPANFRVRRAFWIYILEKYGYILP